MPVIKVSRPVGDKSARCSFMYVMLKKCGALLHDVLLLFFVGACLQVNFCLICMS